MINKKKLVLFFFLISLANCSFDNKSGIWGGSEEEKKRISDLEKKQKQSIEISKVYSSKNYFSEEKDLIQKITLSIPQKNTSWDMPGFNYQNFIGNMHLTGSYNMFLKKRIGKNKFSTSKVTSSPLIYKESIIFADDKGTIFNIYQNGRINWKINIYKKIYKKIYKNLTFAVYKDFIYVADNVGFIYSISIDTGKVIWIKNHGIPLKSKIKVFKNKILLINQDNRIIALSANDGSLIWDVRSVSSFIKSQSFLSLAVSEQGYIIAGNSAGDLIKINSSDGKVLWSLNTLESTLAHATDFFRSSDVVIDNKKQNIIFSNQISIFSYSLDNGYNNWVKAVSSIGTPIIDGDNIFFVTEKGFFIIMKASNGEIISSTNILKVLKKKKRNTKITGFIMGSGKIHAVSLNGYLITCSALSGKAESFKKIANTITSNPIISNGKLYIYTEDSKILGFY